MLDSGRAIGGNAPICTELSLTWKPQLLPDQEPEGCGSLMGRRPIIYLRVEHDSALLIK